MAAFKLSDDQLIAKIEETTVDATRHQLDTLRQILQRNANVGYLRRHLDQSAAVDADNFRRIVPLSTYDDYADYINKIADGMFDDGDEGRHFLSFDPLLCFFLSSGTSEMKQKLIPYFDSAPSKAASYLAHMGSAALLRSIRANQLDFMENNFDLLLQTAIENGAPASQYKSPKIIRNRKMADFLEKQEIY